MDENTNTRAIFDVMMGPWAAQAMYAAVRLGLTEELDGVSATTDELAKRTGTHERSLFQLLRFLAGLGILDPDEKGFSLTERGKLLTTRHGGSLPDLVLIYGDEFYRSWGNLVENVRTGTPAFEMTFGEPMYQYFAQHEETSRRFSGAMAAGSFFPELASAIAVPPDATVVDVAGGTGGLLCALLEERPDVAGVLFDLEHVIEPAGEAIAHRGFADRIRLVNGDYRETVPEGGDLYLLSRILHSRDDESCRDIIGRIRAAARPGSSLVVVERTVPPLGEDSMGLWFDIHMMTLLGGRERDEDEYRRLYEDCGYTLDRVHELPLGMRAFEGTTS